MSKCELQILLDRPSRTYKIGEAVSGMVKVLADSEFQCRKITLIRQWRTHGSGNQAYGGGEEMTLAEETKFLPGETREYSFQLGALHGPVTYHGHHLNVDWYLSAHADIPLAIDVDSEEEFLLVPGKTSEEVLLGSREQVEDISASSRVLKENIAKTGLVAVPLLIAGFLIIKHAGGSNPWTMFVGLLALGYGAWLLFLPRLKNLFAQQKSGDVEIEIDPGRVRTGTRANCRFLFRPQEAFYLEKITATLKGEERVVHGSGRYKSTYTHTICDNTVVQSKPKMMTAGDTIQAALSLQIPHDVPSTFRAPDNALNWFIRVQVAIRGWPDWVQDFPITILP